MYNNNNFYNRPRYGSGGGYSRGFQGNYQQPQRQMKKRSGCRYTTGTDGAPIISAWRKNNKGMYSLYARPYKGSKTITSKSGKEWINLFVTIVNKDTMQEIKTSGLLNLQNKKLYLKEFNLICNPSAPNGGYFGKHISRNYNR